MADNRRALVERALGRSLNDHDKAIVAACGECHIALALICIQESVSVAATEKLAVFFLALLDLQAKLAGRAAAEVLQAERQFPGSVADPDPKQRH